MMTQTSTVPSQEKAISVEEMLAAMNKARLMPKPKWAVIAPDGRTWFEQDPLKLVSVLIGSIQLNMAIEKMDWPDKPIAK